MASAQIHRKYKGIGQKEVITDPQSRGLMKGGSRRGAGGAGVLRTGGAREQAGGRSGCLSRSQWQVHSQVLVAGQASEMQADTSPS